MHIEQADTFSTDLTGSIIFTPEVTLDLFCQRGHGWRYRSQTLFPLLVRGHFIQFTMRSVLVRHDLFHDKLVYIFIQQAGFFCGIMNILGMTRLNSSLQSLLDDCCEPAEKALD